MTPFSIKKFTQEIKKLEKESKIKELERKLNKDGFLLYAHYYLLLGLKLFAEKGDISLELKNKDKIFRNYGKVKKILQNIVKEKKKDPKFSMPYLFKSDDLVKEIKEKIK